MREYDYEIGLWDKLLWIPEKGEISLSCLESGFSLIHISCISIFSISSIFKFQEYTYYILYLIIPQYEFIQLCYTDVIIMFIIRKTTSKSKVGNIPHGLRHQNTTITVRGIDSVIDVSKYASVQKV